MNFALCDHVIYFHCSAAGGKRISGIRHDPNACFTVIEHTKLLPQQFATLYMSGIAYGTIEIVADETEKRNLELAPHRFVENAAGKFIPRTKEEQIDLMRDYCDRFHGENVVAYCHYCVEGLELGGANAKHLASLLFEPAVQ